MDDHTAMYVNISNQMRDLPPLLTGLLIRLEDVSGVSGTGIVADVIQLRTGKVIVSWLPSQSNVSQIEIFDSEQDLLAIHGHEGKTDLIWME